MTDTFEITHDHITLLQAAEWEYNDCEFGAPAIDPKRPYGNSSVELDLVERLTQPPISYPQASQWNGYVPPEQCNQQPNDHPRRQALAELVAEALARDASS